MAKQPKIVVSGKPNILAAGGASAKPPLAKARKTGGLPRNARRGNK